MGNQKLTPKAKGWLTHPRKAMGLFLMVLTVLLLGFEFDMGFYTPVYNSVVVGSFCFNPFGTNLFLFDDFYTL
ncbi:hypothetical protein Peur_050833 [Populus x canadensis]